MAEPMTREELARARDLHAKARECPCTWHADDLAVFTATRLPALIALAERALDAEEGTTKVRWGVRWADGNVATTDWWTRDYAWRVSTDALRKDFSAPGTLVRRSVRYGPWETADG